MKSWVKIPEESIRSELPRAKGITSCKATSFV